MAGRFPLSPATAELMLVIDRSGSMRLAITGEPDAPRDRWRWTTLRDALAASLTTLDARVLVGAKFFPDVITDPSVSIEIGCRPSETVDVLPAVGTAAAITSIFDRTEPVGATPTAMALEAASRGLTPGASRRYLLLATDGAPNCNPDTGVPVSRCVCTGPPETCLAPEPGPYSCLDDRRTIEVVARIAAGGTPTYVVGIEDLSRPELTATLDAMAVAGTRPRTVPGERSFYSVRSREQLQAALDDITDRISACGFVTPSLPSDDSRIVIEIDGRPIAQDAADGWIWTNRAAGELELRGEACTAGRLPGVRIDAVIRECAL